MRECARVDAGVWRRAGVIGAQRAIGRCAPPSSTARCARVRACVYVCLCMYVCARVCVCACARARARVKLYCACVSSLSSCPPSMVLSSTHTTDWLVLSSFSFIASIACANLLSVTSPALMKQHSWQHRCVKVCPDESRASASATLPTRPRACMHEPGWVGVCGHARGRVRCRSRGGRGRGEVAPGL